VQGTQTSDDQGATTTRTNFRLKAGLQTALGEPVLALQQLLNEVVSAIRGADGVVLIAADGEAVAWHSTDNPERLRLRGAYIAVVLRASQLATSQFGAGDVKHLFLCYEGATFLAHEIGGGYFAVVELEPSANLAEALHRLRPFAEKIRAEVGA